MCGELCFVECLIHIFDFGKWIVEGGESCEDVYKIGSEIFFNFSFFKK